MDLVITRTFNAPVSAVWDAWINETKAKQWWGPKDFTCPFAKIDFKVGGKYLLAMHGPKGTEFDKDMYSTGVYKEIILNKKIVLTDSFSDSKGNVISAKEMGFPFDMPREMLVTLTFEEDKGVTQLKLVHEGHPKEIADPAKHGWNQQFDKLEVLLNGDKSMVKKNPVVHFEMPYEDGKRLTNFYSNVFGWELNETGKEMGDYITAATTETDKNRMVKTPGNINGGFYPKSSGAPLEPSVVIAVDDINEAMKKITSAGGKVLGNPVEIPMVGKYVSFIDTEGNRASILQPAMK